MRAALWGSQSCSCAHLHTMPVSVQEQSFLHGKWGWLFQLVFYLHCPFCAILSQQHGGNEEACVGLAQRFAFQNGRFRTCLLLLYHSWRLRVNTWYRAPLGSLFHCAVHQSPALVKHSAALSVLLVRLIATMPGMHVKYHHRSFLCCCAACFFTESCPSYKGETKGEVIGAMRLPGATESSKCSS